MEVEGGDSVTVPSADPVARRARVPWVEAGSTNIESFIPKSVGACAPAPEVRKDGGGGAAAWLGDEPTDEQVAEVAVVGPPAIQEPVAATGQDVANLQEVEHETHGGSADLRTVNSILKTYWDE
eukprot:9210694-Alexandrium_andersonii.AAC.1